MKYSLPPFPSALRQLLLALLGCWHLGGTAQPAEPFHRRYGISDGLPDETLYHLLVDRTGLLWIATEQGLATFNGIHFRQIPVKNAARRPVTSLTQSADGRIWCRDFSKTVYEVVRDTLMVYAPADSLLRAWPQITELTSVGNHLWVCSPTEVATIDLTTAQITHWTKRLQPCPKAYFDLQPNDGNILVLSDVGLHRISPQGKATHIPAVPGSNDTRIAVLGEKLVMHSRGRALDALYQTLFPNAFEKVVVNMPKEVRVYRPRVALGALWVCSNAGVWRQTFSPHLPAEGFFTHDRVSDIVSDAQGNCWLSTLGQGLVYLPNQQLQVTAAGSSITSLAVSPDGSLCAGSHDGNLLFISPDGNLRQSVFTGIRDDVTFLLPTPDGQTIYSTYGWYQQASQKFTLFQPYGETAILGKDAILNDNELLAATAFDAQYIRLYNRKLLERTLIRAARSRAVARLRDGTACVAYADQLMLHPPGSSRVRLRDPVGMFAGHAVDDESIFYLPEVRSMALPDSAGNPVVAYDLLVAGDTLWAATTEQGVLAWLHGQLLPASPWQRALAHHTCTRLYRSGTDLWVVSEGSLYRVSLPTGHLLHFSGTLGLGSTRVNDVVVHAGRIWLATVRGLLNIPVGAAQTIVQAQLSLPAAWHNGHWLIPAQGQTLPAGTAQLRLRIGAVLYANGSSLQLASRLLGRDNDWHPLAPGLFEAEYLSLPPGDYLWQIRAGLPGQPPVITEWRFSIAPAWWQTIWFSGVLILLGVGIASLLVRWQIRRIRKKEGLRQALVASQLTALRAQMNPHFMYNILNSVQGFIYANKKNEASEYLGRFSDLMRKMLDNSAKQYVTVQEEWETLQLYTSLENARSEADMEVVFHLDPKIEPAREIPSMIIQPLVENAIKHGLMHKRSNKSLHISMIQQPGGSLVVTIDDNGIGRAASREQNARRSKRTASFATQAIDSRISLLNSFLPRPISLTLADKYTPDGQAAGTTATLLIP